MRGVDERPRLAAGVPWATAAVVAVLAGAYAAHGAVLAPTIGAAAWWGPRADEARVLVGGHYAPWVARGELWRLVTGPSVHAGPAHLALNLLGLGLVGGLVEAWVGARAWLVALGAGAVAGATLAHLSGVLHADGASAAVAGGLALGWVRGLRDRHALPAADADLALVGFGAGLAADLALAAAVPGVSLAAHVGGSLTGLAVGIWHARGGLPVDGGPSAP